MDTFKLSNEYVIECEYNSTRSGFRHFATLYKNDHNVMKVKRCYLNRTWESYSFQSVIHDLIDKYFNESEAKGFKAIADSLGKGESESFINSLTMLSKLGDVLSSSEAEANTFKKNILSKLPGIEFPDDFDNLPEKEKTRRLNGALRAN